MLVDELCSDDFRDIRKVLVVQDVINVFPVLFIQLFRSEFLSLRIFFLEFLQPQFYATNTGSIKTFAQQLALEQVLKLLQLG